MDRICAHCQQQFTITTADTAFYQKIAVPPPTWCPPCRLQRRMAWRNEKTLYQRQCDLCQQTIISIYRPGAPFPVYCQTCWWSDQWDPLHYGQPYDPKQYFFAQLQQLHQRVPRVALTNTNSENSDYTNYAGNDKNCYLIFANANGHNENCAYGKCFSACRDTVDGLYLQDCELVYNSIDCRSCYRVAHAQYCSNCSEAMYVEDCNNCQNCIGCKGLRNKQYYIFNQPYSKADYERKLHSLQLDTAAGHEALRQQWE